MKEAEPRSLVYIDEARHAQGLVDPDDVRLAKVIGAELDKHYPGHLWMVWAEHTQGVAVIRHTGQEQWEKLGFVIKLPNLYSDHALKCVMRAGGELLERMNVVRGVFKPEDFLARRIAEK